MFNFIKTIIEDCKVNRFNPKSCILVILYRIANLASVKRKENPLIHSLWSIPILILYRFINEFLFGLEIPAATKIGKRLTLHHGYSIVINKDTVIGDDCIIRHGVTIGNKFEGGAVPKIGDRVEFGAGVIVIGDINIGSDSKIGAGVVITKSIPQKSIIVTAAPRHIDNLIKPIKL